MSVSETELLETQGEEQQKKMNTHLPAEVISFDAATQTVSIKILIDQIDHNDEAMPLPPLVDVPVKFPQWGAFYMCAEPKQGDTGLAHFSDRCIDGWWESGENSVPLDIRFHDLSDAFFDPGYNSQAKALKIIPNAMHVGSDECYIQIFEDGKIEIKGKTTFKDEATFEKSIKATGEISSAADVKAGSTSLKQHLHGGVQSGSSLTSPPTT